MAQIAALLLIALGLLVIVAWIFKLPALLQGPPGQVGMVLSTALCFLFAGVALLIPEHLPRVRRRAQTGIGSLIIVVALAMLSQHIFQINLGIDLQSFHTWLEDPNPTPGRMAPNTALAFLLSGIALLLLPYAHRSLALRAIEVLAFGTIFIGLLSIAGYGMKLEFLYGWYQYTRMALPTAAGMLILGAGLWSAGFESPAARQPLLRPTQNRILWIGGSLFFIIALVAGLVGFASMQQRAEKTLHDDLQRSLQTRIDLFISTIDQASTMSQLIATRPTLRHLLAKLNTSPGNADAIKQLAASAQGFLQHGFSSVTFYDRRGRKLLNTGKFVDASELTMNLSTPTPVKLLWHEGILFETRLPITETGQFLGTVVLQRPLKTLTHTLQDTQRLGKTGENGVCAAVGNRTMRCFPLRFKSVVAEFPYEIDGRRLPMSFALEGKSGLIMTLDYRRHIVVATYAPIGTLGLGMVLKKDTAELYGPISDQLGWSVFLLTALIAAGMWILYLLISPLVRRLVTSEERYRAVAETALDAIVTANTKGQIVFWNRAAETIFGYSEAQILGQPLTRLMPERYRGPHQQGWDRLQKTNQPRLLWSTVELHGLRQDGTEFPLELSLSRWETRGEQFFTGLMRDITRRKQAEQAARRLVNIVESSSDAIVSTNLDGTITSWNAAAEWLYGYSAAEIIGKPGQILLPPDRISEEQNFLERLRRGERITRYKTHRLRKDGTTVEVALTVSALRDASGYIEGISIIARDLTERRTSPRDTEAGARLD